MLCSIISPVEISDSLSRIPAHEHDSETVNDDKANGGEEVEATQVLVPLVLVVAVDEEGAVHEGHDPGPGAEAGVEQTDNLAAVLAAEVVDVNTQGSHVGEDCAKPCTRQKSKASQ